MKWFLLSFALFVDVFWPSSPPTCWQCCYHRSQHFFYMLQMQYCLCILLAFWIIWHAVSSLNGSVALLIEASAAGFEIQVNAIICKQRNFQFLIVTACVMIYSTEVASEVRFEVPVKAVNWERRIFKFLIVTVCVVIYSLQSRVSLLSLPLFSLSMFHLLALLADPRTDNA